MRRLARIVIIASLGCASLLLAWSLHGDHAARTGDDTAQASPAIAALAASGQTPHLFSPAHPAALHAAAAKIALPSSGSTTSRVSEHPSMPASSPRHQPAAAEPRLSSMKQPSTTPQATLRIITRRLEPAVVGAPYRVILAAHGGTLPYSWSLQEGWLPEGLRLDETHGLIVGTPLKPQRRTFTIQVRDAADHSTVHQFVLTALEVDLPVPQPEAQLPPLELLTTALPDGVIGRDYFAQLRARGGVPPYRWSLVGGALPEGLTFDGRLGVIAGVPTQDGLFQLQVQLRDTQGTTITTRFTLRITTSPLYLVSGSCPVGYVGVPYECVFMAQGGHPPYTWSLVAGTLPDGLILEERGRISGVPTKAGVFLVHIRVSDQDDISDTAEFRFNIADGQLTADPFGLACTVDEPCSTTLHAVGGIPPYRWGLADGSRLPSGITLTDQGLLSGIPTEAGQWRVTVQVTDQGWMQARQDGTLTVVEPEPEDPPIPPVTHCIAAPSDGKVGLAWRNPSSPRYDHTLLVRRAHREPAGPDDGTTVYTGTDTQFVDTGLTNGTTYYYLAVGVDLRGRAGQIAEDSRAQATPQAGDPYADAVASFAPLHPNPFGSTGLPAIVLGLPKGGGTAQGSLDVVSLGCGVNTDQGRSAPYGGSITLEFSNNIIVDESGVDFTVFENTFYQGGDPQKRFMEPAVVEVSQDGQTFSRFPFDYVPHFTPSNQVDFKNPFSYSYGFAGINPVFSNLGSPDPTNPSVSGGDSFDLATLPNRPPLKWVKYVRITDTGDQWLTDVNGDLVRHVNDPLLRACERTASNAGFDLDAVAAVHY